MSKKRESFMEHKKAKHSVWMKKSKEQKQKSVIVTRHKKALTKKESKKK